MKKFLLLSVIILSFNFANAQSAKNISDASFSKNLLVSKNTKKVKLDDVILSKQPLGTKNKKYKTFESKIVIDNDYTYNYIVFYNNSKLNSIVKLNPIGTSKSIPLDRFVDLKNLDFFGKKSIALDEY